MCEIASRTASATPPETAKPRPARRAFAQRRGLGDLVKVDALGLEHAHDLFKRQDKIDFAAHGRAHGFKLLCAARPDERDLLARVLLLAEARREHHGVSAMEMQFACSGKSFFAMTAQLGQQDVAMNGWLGGDLLQKVLRLVKRAEVCCRRPLPPHAGSRASSSRP